MQFNQYEDIILICGMMTSGKSIFLKWLTHRIDRKIVWDYNHEHSDMGKVVNYSNMISSIHRKLKPMKIVVQPMLKGNAEFEEFCNETYQIPNQTTIIEEVERYETSHTITSNFGRLLDTGRHRGIGIICTCRRTRRINNAIPFNAKHIFVFKQHLPQDIDYLAEFMGKNVEQIKTAPLYSYVHFDATQGTTQLYNPLPYHK